MSSRYNSKDLKILLTQNAALQIGLIQIIKWNSKNNNYEARILSTQLKLVFTM